MIIIDMMLKPCYQDAKESGYTINQMQEDDDNKEDDEEVKKHESNRS